MEIIRDRGCKSGAFEKITVGGTAGGFTAAKIRPTSGDFSGKVAQEAYVTVETNSIRYNIDGSTPTSTSGHLVEAKGIITLKTASDLDNFKAIKVTDDDATIQVTFKFE